MPSLLFGGTLKSTTEPQWLRPAPPIHVEEHACIAGKFRTSSSGQHFSTALPSSVSMPLASGRTVTSLCVSVCNELAVPTPFLVQVRLYYMTFNGLYQNAEGHEVTQTNVSVVVPVPAGNAAFVTLTFPISPPLIPGASSLMVLAQSNLAPGPGSVMSVALNTL